MGNPPPRPTIIIDECLPRHQLRTFLASRGYTVYTVGEVFPSGSPDASILAVAELHAAIILSSDTDWRTLLTTVHGNQGKFRRAGRILFNCDHSVIMSRLVALIDDIEREYEVAQLIGRQLIVRITGHTFTIDK